MNKRHSSQRILLLIVWFAWTLALTSAQQQSAPDNSTRFFRSNSLGMAIEEVSSYRADDYEYVLKRTMNGSSVTEILFRNDKEVQRAEYEWKGQVKYGRFFEQGTLVRETVETEGRLREERLFSVSDSSSPAERRVYQWRDGELQGVQVFSDGEATAAEEKYIRSNEGKLLQVVRKETDAPGEARVAGIYSSPDQSQSQWHFTGQGTSYFFYSDQTNRVSEQYRQGELVYRKEVLETGESTVIDELYPQEEKRIRSVYSADGRLLSSRTTAPDVTVRSEYSYQNGELNELRQTRNGTEKRILYTRGAGEQADETIYENGVLQKQVQYHGEDRRTEVLYRNGEAVARVEYEGEEAVSRDSLIGDSR